MTLFHCHTWGDPYDRERIAIYSGSSIIGTEHIWWQNCTECGITTVKRKKFM